MERVVYEYTWGAEEILGALIQIKKLDETRFMIFLRQETFYKPLKLITLHEITYENHIVEEETDGIPIVYLTWVEIKVKCNPPPEDMFSLVAATSVTK